VDFIRTKWVNTVVNGVATGRLSVQTVWAFLLALVWFFQRVQTGHDMLNTEQDHVYITITGLEDLANVTAVTSRVQVAAMKY
jgi:hypothetical protein